MTTVPYPPPRASAETAPYWDALAAGDLLLPWCRSCDRAFFPPRAVCPRCWGDDLSWRRSRGRGRIVVAAVVHRPGHAAFRADGHYTIAVVELEEDVRITMAVRDQQLVVGGQAVSVGTRERDGVTVPVADPVGVGHHADDDDRGSEVPHG